MDPSKSTKAIADALSRQGPDPIFFAVLYLLHIVGGVFGFSGSESLAGMGLVAIAYIGSGFIRNRRNERFAEIAVHDEEAKLETVKAPQRMRLAPEQPALPFQQGSSQTAPQHKRRERP